MTSKTERQAKLRARDPEDIKPSRRQSRGPKPGQGRLAQPEKSEPDNDDTVELSMNYTKAEILDALAAANIEADENLTKAELLELFANDGNDDDNGNGE